MSKTPYEIRLELLKLAKETLFEPIYLKRDSADGSLCGISSCSLKFSFVFNELLSFFAIRTASGTPVAKKKARTTS